MTQSAARAIERAIADACLGETTVGTRASALQEFLAARGVATEDIDAILSAPPRLAVYRSLVQNGLKAVIARVLPLTRARMDSQHPGRFDGDVARFLSEIGPRTHYLRDVPSEFLAWALPRWRTSGAVQGYLPDLATHEAAYFAVSASENAPASPAGEVDLRSPVAFTSSMARVHYAWAVHELSVDEGTALPVRRDVRLLGYRDADNVVHWLELTPLADSIVRRLASGETLGDAVTRACTDHDTAPASVSDAIARLMTDLSERGVLLGSRPGSAADPKA
ncbi:MAG: HvfC family peptide modification chaperone [Polyangiaceae bacterium]